MRKMKNRAYTNALFQKITVLFTCVLLIMGALVCYFAYSNEYNKTMSSLDDVMQDLKYNYISRTEEFWQIYMPIFENREVYGVLERYYEFEGETLSPFEIQELTVALRRVMQYDDRIQWIGVYANGREINYLLMNGDSTVTQMGPTFPFDREIRSKEAAMEIYGSKLVAGQYRNLQCFAICGNAPEGMGDGKLVIGYATQGLQSSYYAANTVEDVRFWLTNKNGVIFDSYNLYDTVPPEETGVFRWNGELIRAGKLENTGSSYKIFYTMPWVDTVWENHQYTLIVLLAFLVFWVCSLILYNVTGRIIIRKVDSIHYGLKKIADNDLQYRIPVPQEPADEFEKISHAVNQMSQRLQDNIDSAYQFKLRQREAELSELQAKFDPHFLYNTLEVIRGRACENGDDETANVMIKLAQIFRSFIRSENFVSIQEELDFCSQYLAILKYRYEDQAQIVYDIDSDVLPCGIIRNLIQPILENYFIHGFDPTRQDNRLVIRGKIEDGYVRFFFRDNGLGISGERLCALQEKLDTIEPQGRGGYGLRNVNKRIQLFYGTDCGLRIDRNEDNGATIELKILKLSCQEHRKKMSYS